MMFILVGWIACGVVSGVVLGRYNWKNADLSSGGVMGALPGMFQQWVITPVVFLLGVVSGPIGALAFWKNWI